LKTFDLRTLLMAAVVGLLAVLGTAGSATAQRRSGDQSADQKKQEKKEKQLAKDQRQRQAEWSKRNSKFGTTRTVTTGHYSLDPTTNVAPGRYRVNRNGRWYNTDDHGADMLRQAVNEGYRQGFAAGRTDLNTRRRGGWATSNVYRNGTYGFQNGVDRSQYQYYFRQGFQRGYQDGSNSQYNNGFTGDFQYGTNSGGSVNILGAILNQILNLQSY
jgi:hypothetical protein